MACPASSVLRTFENPFYPNSPLKPSHGQAIHLTLTRRNATTLIWLTVGFFRGKSMFLQPPGEKGKPRMLVYLC